LRQGVGALAAVAVLLAGCSGDTDEPDLPEPGPLELVSGAGCAAAPAGGVIVTAAEAVNTADIPLTIDEVNLAHAENLVFVEAMVADQVPAVDATMPEHGAPGARQTLVLHLHIIDESIPATYTAVMVDYHNVEGRFRATGVASGDLSQLCRP
jgi:hypothetical protein